MNKSFVVLVRLLLVMVLGIACGRLASAADDKPAMKSFEGILKTGVMAIGGETTGIILVTKADGTYELDLKRNVELEKLTDSLNGKKVVVEGEYKPRPGIEVKERRIILVKSITEAR